LAISQDHAAVTGFNDDLSLYREAGPVLIDIYRFDSRCGLDRYSQAKDQKDKPRCQLQQVVAVLKYFPPERLHVVLHPRCHEAHHSQKGNFAPTPLFFSVKIASSLRITVVLRRKDGIGLPIPPLL